MRGEEDDGDKRNGEKEREGTLSEGGEGRKERSRGRKEISRSCRKKRGRE